MSKPINLWRPRPSLASDDAGTTIFKYTIPQTITQPPYGSTRDSAASSLLYVPSLAYFCIQTLLPFPDQLHSLGPARLLYQPPESPDAYDILRALIPEYRTNEPLHPSQVDPRLWAILVQLYTHLPSTFRRYTLPLSDEHLPLLQRIPCTAEFALLTVLELPGCRELTDDTIVELRALHGLCALDASGTALSSWGIKRLSKTLVFSEDEDDIPASTRGSRCGPWGLRILSLRNCMSIISDIFDCLGSFPLLSVVDLRGTRCLSSLSGPFRPSQDAALYHPSSLTDALSRLSQISSPEIFSHQQPFILHVKGLHHQAPPKSNMSRLTGHPTETGKRNVFMPFGVVPDILVPGSGRDDDDDISTDSGNDDGDTDGEEQYGDEDACGDEDSCGDDDSRNEDDFSGDDYSDDGTTVTDEYTHDISQDGVTRRNRLPSLLDPLSAVTTEEARIHAQRTSILRFYAEPSRSRPPLISRAVPPSVAPVLLHPLMLYRPPRPWSILPSSPADVQSASDLHKPKRPRSSRTLADGELIAANSVRQSSRVQHGLNDLRRMMEIRAASTAASRDAEQAKETNSSPLSSNPFMRKAPVSKARKWQGDEVNRQGASCAKEPGSNSVACRKTLGSSAPLKSDPTILATKRPLKPISTLTKPGLPPSTRPNHKMKALRRSTQPMNKTKQIMLPQLSSTPATTTNALHSASGAKGMQKADKPKTAQNLVNGKNRSQGVRFDWKSWGCGS